MASMKARPYSRSTVTLPLYEPMALQRGDQSRLDIGSAQTTYQIIPAALACSRSTSSGQAEKSSMTSEVSFRCSTDNFRRPNAMTSVMSGWARHCMRASPPMDPLAPTIRIFIVRAAGDEGGDDD